MRNRKLLFFLFFILLSFKGFCAVIVVTSNADSGPGTLRDALTQAAANGNTKMDSIVFNLPDLTLAGRTITILSNLPIINSDMIIDGSTQPGVTLSVNGAKIVIAGNYITGNTPADYFVIKSVNHLEIDGLVIKCVYKQPYNNYNGVAAIVVSGNNKTIKFGQPGKGNVIYDCSQAVVCAVGESYYFPDKSSTDSIIVKNNFIGVEEDGVALNNNGSSTFGLNYITNAILGGNTKAEGNVFYSAVSVLPSYGFDTFSVNFNLIVKNNIFGANAFQQTNQTASPGFFDTGADPNNTDSNASSIQITDNVFGYEAEVTGLQMLTMQIQHNYFGVSADQKNNLPIKAGALRLTYLEGTILVGGSDTSKGNVFAHCSQDTTATFYQSGVVNVATLSNTLDPLYKIELSHNSFYCNNSQPFLYYLASDKKPLAVAVDNLTATTVSGTTTKPNARVELFYTDLECTQCQPKTYIATANSDANGKWTYTGSLKAGYGIMAGATYNQVSSEFTDTRVYDQQLNVVIVQAECDMGGSITGLDTINAKKVEWVNSSGQVVGTHINLTNVTAGRYRLKAEQFGCVVYSGWYNILDYSPVIDSQYVHIINPSCGVGGSISNLNVYNYASYAWLDASGKVVSNQLDITNLAAGSYTLHVNGNGSCTKNYGPITLKNTTGPSIDQSNVKITSTNCGQSTGSITNITATGTGTLKYIWWDSQQNNVGTNKDLTGQPAGTYKLEVTDATQCGPIYTSDIVIPETNGITTDESKAQTTVASCSLANGSVTGIQVTGATQYQWLNANNKVVGTNTDLQNVAAGVYTLTASNGFGCSKISKAYTVTQQAPTKFPIYNYSIISSCFGAYSGSVTVVIDGLVKAMRWFNSQGIVLSNGSFINKLAAGTYQLYLTDQNGCESFYERYIVPEYPQYVVANNGQITNEQCGLKNGGVGKTAVTGGLTPYTYKWTDARGTQVGSDNSISNLAAGTYTLNVTDNGCGNASATYTITEETETIAAPLASNIQLCSSGSALLSVSDPSSALSYHLYDTQSSIQSIDEQSIGRFRITASGNRSYYVSAVKGICESSRTEVKVSVGLSSINIANAFTPNGDYINDYWQIDGVENYPEAHVQVFTRYGEKIFDSKGYTIPFDGTYNNQKLPSGVYYYIINLNALCSLLSGSLTIIR